MLKNGFSIRPAHPAHHHFFPKIQINNEKRAGTFEAFSQTYTNDDSSVFFPLPRLLRRYKTELCHPFEENGVCKYGEKCQFAHGFHELRDLARHPKYKTELCRTFHAEGYCPYGARCHFIHEERSLAKGKPSSLCLFSPAAAALGCHGGSGPILSASSVKDLSMSPNSLSSLSPASSTNAFSFAAGPIYSPPPSPIEARLPIFNEISAPTPLFPVGRQFGGGLTA